MMHKASWDEMFGSVQKTEVFTKGERFGVMMDWLFHCHWVI